MRGRRLPGVNRLARIIGIITVWATVLLAGIGCGPKQVTLNVRVSQNNNQGQPVCMVVRAVNEKAFLTESYLTVASMIYTDPRDESVLEVRMVMPGEKHKIRVPWPEKDPLGVYCMYTEPEQWKVLLPQPLATTYYFALEGSDVVQKQKSFFQRVLSPEPVRK